MGIWICKVPMSDLIYIHFLISSPLASIEIQFHCRVLYNVYSIYVVLNLFRTYNFIYFLLCKTVCMHEW